MHRKRILLGKTGLDGHTVGLQVMSKAFRDAGYEVIYAGILLKPSELVESAVQEDVDIIGVSILSGAHLEQIGLLLRLMKEKSLDDTPLIVGGVMPEKDVQVLKDQGMEEFFGPGASIPDIIKRVDEIVEKYAQAGFK